ncbi:MAG: Trk system potassium transporter TrkA [Alphaproteobacteria bacterium]|nr:Trk system potassium transporter TrkA [Alphaproteobacteria bacterium]
MKIIVCGSGAVAKSVISYLVKGANDIIVVDDNQRRLDELSKEFDILPITGTPSHPDVLEHAGAKDTDIILALTSSDEMNMIICQLAYSLFDIRKKIAAVNSETFLDPLWGMLYNDNHLPIDLLISPDIDIAEHILKILQYPGATGVLPIWQGKYSIITLNLGAEIPFSDMPLGQIIKQPGASSLGVVNIVRDNVSFLPDMYETLHPADQINLLVKTEEIYSVISAFGLEKPTNERIVLFGGTPIAQYLCQRLEADDSITSTRLIEADIDKAKVLARRLNRTVVINGEMMSDVILSEAEIAKADTAIAVTDNDKDNLLASLLASHDGVGSTIAVINTPSYNNLMFNISDNTLVERSAITISRLLKEIRRSNIENAYSIARSQGEIWDIALNENNCCVGKKNGELGLSKNSRIIAVLRGGEIIYPDMNTKLEAGDRLLIYVDSAAIKKAEEIFC